MADLSKADNLIIPTSAVPSTGGITSIYESPNNGIVNYSGGKRKSNKKRRNKKGKSKKSYSVLNKWMKFSSK
jgi:hypothetical protein